MISLENISFSYPCRHDAVLEGIDIRIDKLSWVIVTGREGSGKTTLGKIIKGLLEPSSGIISIANDRTNNGYLNIGYIPGNPIEFLVGTTVEEEIVFGLETLQFSNQEIERRLKQSLGWTHLQGMEKRLTHTLSGGEQQKLALASVLATGARIIILDEALSMLDRSTVTRIRSLIKTLQIKHELTIIEMTYNSRDILKGDRILFLEDGKIVFDGAPREFVNHRLGREWLSFSGILPSLECAPLNL